MIAPVLDELAEDTTTARSESARSISTTNKGWRPINAVRAIPTLLLFQNGQVAEQIVGLKSKRDLKNSFDKVAA